MKYEKAKKSRQTRNASAGFFVVNRTESAAAAKVSPPHGKP